MDEESKELLRSLGVPEHIWLLMNLYGLRSLDDLSALDGDVIKDIEMCVGNGTFSEMVDFGSKAIRQNYLGYDCKNLMTFKFKPFDLRKLMSVGVLAINQKKVNGEKKDQMRARAIVGKR